jgi:hypothetical protein
MRTIIIIEFFVMILFVLAKAVAIAVILKKDRNSKIIKMFNKDMHDIVILGLFGAMTDTDWSDSISMIVGAIGLALCTALFMLYFVMEFKRRKTPGGILRIGVEEDGS